MFIPEASILKRTLYDPWFEHDGCGIGFVADVTGHASHAVLSKAIEALSNLSHRGAIDADGKSGDGAGILTPLPYKLFNRELGKLGQALVSRGDLAVAMLFLPRTDAPARVRSQQIVEQTVAQYGLPFLGWRQVPVDESALGHRAQETRPDIWNAFIGRPDGLAGDLPFEQVLYQARRQIESQVREEGITGFYVPSMSAQTICYKGLFISPQLPRFYPDLADPDFRVPLAVFHQRYSTNTFPTWERAQPFRLMCHNGEINTLQGNVNWMRAREHDLRSPAWPEMNYIRPVIDLAGSDSAMLDNVLELLTLAGRDIRHALMMLVPEAWEKIPDMDPAWTAFYRYHACLMEPWDGPAAITFTDGRIVGTTLDRNGLRPARYVILDDDTIYSGSEVGALEFDEARVIQKGKLGPGQMIAVDTARGELLSNAEIKDHFARQRPYGLWVNRQLRTLSIQGNRETGTQGDVSSSSHPPVYLSTCLPVYLLQAAFGYTAEELTVVLRPMVQDGYEPVGSMGDDTPHAVFSPKHRPLYNYFKQRFAEVTNPPIDPLREELVMSLRTLLGRRGNLLEETDEQAHLLQLSSPILTDAGLQALYEIDDPAFRSITLPATWEVDKGEDGLELAVAELCYVASQAVDQGHTILVLSDWGVNATRAPIPTLLAVGAVHHHLIREGKRMHASLVVESGEAREVHHFAALIGYGANAVNPYLALATARSLVEAGQLRHKALDPEEGIRNYVKAVEKGLLKVMSKMGISTLDSYCGAQIFEVVGLNAHLVEHCFRETPSRIGGIGFRELARDVLSWHVRAFHLEDSTQNVVLDSPGFYKYKKGGEHHAWQPAAVQALHKAVRTPGVRNGNFHQGYAAYQEFAELNNRPSPPVEPRDLLDFCSDRPPVPLDEVETIDAIVRRFSSAAMSHGALSREAHEAIAIAMTRLGALSNAGEGGEDPARFGSEVNSHIKQVASGRFGVTPAYLVHSDELQIKMAQGSKPGEGGQLPGHKVTAEIARIRHTTPGVALISPPPHHDIYSIEDLAQLIYDLKQANPKAMVSVKLVSEAGVGTIAAGVAKGRADVILISGHAGGTGASPLSSIKNAGIPWELGLAETQQTLIFNNLRGRVRLRTDGGLRTGRDVIIAAMLGADEFSFGTGAVVAAGCLMARTCHTNTCPVGVATQDPALRAKFPGTPEMVMNYFLFVAQEVREMLAWLGYRNLSEIIGRTDLMCQVHTGHPQADALDLGSILANADPTGMRHRRYVGERNVPPPRPNLNDLLVQDARPAVEGRGRMQLTYSITNRDRTVGATLAGEIARRYGDGGLTAGSIEMTFRGSAGQSFGAFCIQGLRLVLIGEANDYVGKGMAGGEIIIRPPENARYASHQNHIIGNTVMYGATGGRLYAAGKAGERFCVRNSGGRAVVEGVGDHGCEYMTGGVVVVLGETGRNFGAGMTGGLAFVLDESGDFPARCNPELVRVERVTRPKEFEALQWLINRHLEMTNSPRAQDILADWDHYRPLFWRIAPKDSIAEIEAINEGTMEALYVLRPFVEVTPVAAGA